MKSNSQTSVMAQQSAELRQQVNSQPFKPAQVVGKVELKPRVEVKVPRSKPLPPKPPPTTVAGPGRPRGLKRADDSREKVAGNQQMLQELQYVKKQLRDAKDRGDKLATDLALLRADAKDLLALVTNDGYTILAGSEPFKRLNANFEAAPAETASAGLQVVLAQTDLGPPKPMVPVLVPLETIKKMAAQDDLVGKAIELSVTTVA